MSYSYLEFCLCFLVVSFQVKKEEVPVFKEQKTQNQEKDVPTFGQKSNDSMSNVEKYEKAYEQELKTALEEIAGVKRRND